MSMNLPKMSGNRTLSCCRKIKVQQLINLQHWIGHAHKKEFGKQKYLPLGYQYSHLKTNKRIYNKTQNFCESIIDSLIDAISIRQSRERDSGANFGQIRLEVGYFPSFPVSLCRWSFAACSKPPSIKSSHSSLSEGVTTWPGWTTNPDKTK